MFDAKKEIKNLLSKEHYDFEDLCNLVRVLRSEDGCPWDREQTNKSVRNSFIDETYEFIEGLDTNNDELMCEELGDVLFQIVFHAEIKNENGIFGMKNVTDEICKKMILRHPHVFGDVKVDGSNDVVKNWEIIKNEEKQRKTPYMQLDSIAKSLPSLMRGQKLRKKADKTGLEKLPTVKESVDEARKALDKIERDGINKANIGELLFACCGISCCGAVEAEEALCEKNNEFLKGLSDDVK